MSFQEGKTRCHWSGGIILAFGMAYVGLMLWALGTLIQWAGEAVGRWVMQ